MANCSCRVHLDPIIVYRDNAAYHHVHFRRGAEHAMSTDNQNASARQNNILNLGNIKDLGKIISWIVIIPASFGFLSDKIPINSVSFGFLSDRYGIGLLNSAGENWILMALFGVLALLIAGPLDLGLGLSKLFRNDPDRDRSIRRSKVSLLWDFFSGRSFWSGLGATLLVFMIWSVIFFCDRYDLYGSADTDTQEKASHSASSPRNPNGSNPSPINSIFDEFKNAFVRVFLDTNPKPQGLGDRLRNLRNGDETKQLVFLPLYLILGSLPLLAILGLCVVFPNNAANSARELQTDRWSARLGYQAVEFLGYVVGGIVACLIAAVPVWVAFKLNGDPFHHEMIRALDPVLNSKWVNWLVSATRLENNEFVHVSLFIFIFFVIYSGVLWFTPDLPPGLGISLVLNLIVLGYFLVKIIEPALNLPVIGGAIVFLIFVNAWPYKYRYPNMGSEYDKPVDLHAIEKLIEEGKLNPKGDPELLNDKEVLRAWKDGICQRGGEGKPKLLLVAVTGGAYRASFWTTVVLRQLCENFPGFFDHVRLITGASGGMVGAAYAPALVKAAGKGDDAAKQATEILETETDRNSLTPVITQLVRRDLPKAILPGFWPQQEDRGTILEDQWKTLDVTFESLKKGEKEGWRPSLVISPMIVETGRRLIFSNLDLYGLTDEQARQRIGVSVDGGDGTKSPLNSGGVGRRISRSAVEFFRGFPSLQGGSEEKNEAFKLKTAVRMNAAFPFVSPAVSLPTDPPRRVVDAGYYDNYGVDLATAWIYHNRDWLEENTSGVALIQIRAYSSESIRKRVWVGPRDAPPSLIDWLFNRLVVGLQALTTPLAGVGSARQWSMSYRNDQTIQRLYEYMNFVSKTARARNPSAASNASPKLGWFETFVFENPIPFGMNWFISKAEIERMRQALNTCPLRKPDGDDGIFDNCKQIEFFKEWWNRTEADTPSGSTAPSAPMEK